VKESACVFVLKWSTYFTNVFLFAKPTHVAYSAGVFRYETLHNLKVFYFSTYSPSLTMFIIEVMDLKEMSCKIYGRGCNTSWKVEN
jgi:hypothetical protein